MNPAEPPPHDSGLMDWNALDETQQALFIEGCTLFDEGKFWHAHESWEDLWKSLKPLDRPVETNAIQGIIQCAALLYNYEKRKVSTSTKFTKSIRFVHCLIKWMSNIDNNSALLRCNPSLQWLIWVF